MRSVTEPGLQYLMELGIRPAKDKAGIYKQLRDKTGETHAKPIMEAIWNASTAQALYDIKNSDMTTAITFSGAYDGDIYRKACNWIYQHREVLGETILEVGCDCGIISCFLGRIAPQAKIVAIDRTENAITAAKQLADRMGVQNVTFLQMSVDQLDERQYDTVLSMRTMHENIATKDIAPSFELLLDQAVLYGNTVSNYAEQLIEKVKDGGTFVTIERCEQNPMFLGWLLNLHENGLVLHKEHYAQLCCDVLGETSYFQAISAVKADNRIDNVYAFWCSLFPVDADAYVFHDWEGEAILQNSVQDLGQLLAGFYVYNQAEQRCGKYAVWTLNSQPDALLYYQGNTEQTTVGFYAIDLKNEILQQLEALRSQCLKQNLSCKKIEDSLK